MHNYFHSHLRTAALFLVAAVSVPRAVAQISAGSAGNNPNDPTKVDYSKSPKSFPNLFAPYERLTLKPPNLQNSPRIQQLIHDGKLTLSLNDAVALALENNLDLAIARYNLDI